MGGVLPMTPPWSSDPKQGRKPVTTAWQWRGMSPQKARDHLLKGRPLGLVAGTLGAPEPHKGDGLDFLDLDWGGDVAHRQMHALRSRPGSGATRTPGHSAWGYGPAPKDVTSASFSSRTGAAAAT